MDLKDFVKQALTEIVAAVHEARAATLDVDGGAKIAPRLSTHAAGASGIEVAQEDGGGRAFLVDFDLSVAATEGNEVKAGAGGKVQIMTIFSTKADASGTINDQRVTTQRIKFSVPIRYPQTAEAPPPPLPVPRTGII